MTIEYFIDFITNETAREHITQLAMEKDNQITPLKSIKFDGKRIYFNITDEKGNPNVNIKNINYFDRLFHSIDDSQYSFIFETKDYEVIKVHMSMEDDYSPFCYDEMTQKIYDDVVKVIHKHLEKFKGKKVLIHHGTNVWNTVAGEDGAVKVGKVEMSTDQIDARISSDEIAKSLIEKFIKASNDEVKGKELIKNLDLNNAYNTLSGNSLKPAGLAELQKAGMFNSVSAQNYVNNNGQTVNLSIGDIYIQEPVGDSTNLAQEIIKRLPNAIERQIHKVR